ncbi:MAG TPA: STAS domain-containing protein [Micromonosporaceae bacterium]|nr:STAS domain-containing protein [Micromonosporaceae bacterium]
MEFDCTVERSGDVVVVTPAGDIDLQTTSSMRQVLQEAVATAGLSRIDVDLRNVTYLDSSGIGVFVAAYKAAAEKGAVFRLRELQPIVRMVLEVTRLADLLVTGSAQPSGPASPSAPAPDRPAG